MNASLLNMIQNTPPDNKTMYYYINFIEGNLEDIITGSDESIKQKNPEFIVTGDYTTFVQISNGQMSSAMALLKNRVKLTGNKMKALTITKPIDTYNKCVSGIQTEY